MGFVRIQHCVRSNGLLSPLLPCRELRPSLTEYYLQRGSKKSELDELRRSYIQEKSFTVIQMWECEWLRLHKTTINVKLHILENFSCRRSLTEHQFLEEYRKETLVTFNATLKYL